MRVNGPYQHGQKWRIVVVHSGKRDTMTFATEREALNAATAMRGAGRRKGSIVSAAALLRSAMHLPADATWVYLLRSEEDGSVIYVGITMSPGSRMAEHRAGGKRFVTWLIPVPLPRAEAMRVETVLIRHFKPPMNVAGLGTIRSRSVPSGFPAGGSDQNAQ